MRQPLIDQNMSDAGVTTTSVHKPLDITPTDGTIATDDATDLTTTSPATTDAKPTVLKTTTTTSVTADDKRALRANRFADNRLSERANRFGLADVSSTTSATTATTGGAVVVDKKLKDRATRFGTVCPKLKTLEDNERLDKRRQRFAITSPATSTTSTTSSASAATATTDSLKRKNNFSDKKQQRLARFGTAS